MLLLIVGVIIGILLVTLIIALWVISELITFDTDWQTSEGTDEYT